MSGYVARTCLSSLGTPTARDLVGAASSVAHGMEGRAARRASRPSGPFERQPKIRGSTHGPLDRATRSAIAVVALAFAILNIAACNAPLTQRPNDQPSTLGATQGVEPHRVHIIADFDRFASAKFRIDPPDEPAAISIESGAGRPETGPRGLRATLPPNAALIADPGGGWAGDWRDFTMLGAAVHCESDDVSIVLELRSGSAGDLVFRTSPMRLRAGWNNVRFDLADAGARLDAAYVAAIALRVAERAEPVTLWLDDLTLLDNRRDLLGTPDGPEGALYARQIGTRLIVGASGRFELVFQSGLVTRCYQTAVDPHRLASLCLNGPLGPVPLPIHSAAIRAGEAVSLDVAALAASGGPSRLRRTHRLVEANALRIVVEAEWSWTVAESASQPTTPEALVFRYAIDACGRVHVAVRSAAVETFAMPPPFAVFIDAADDRAWQFDVQNTGSRRGRYLRAAARAADEPRDELIWIVCEYGDDAGLRSLRPLDSTLSAAVLADPRGPAAPLVHRSVLLVWPGLWADRPADARLWADATWPARAAGPRTSVMAFDPIENAYRVDCRSGRARFSLEEVGVVRFRPMLLLDGTSGRRAFVTCNGLMMRSDQRAADGSVLVELPEILRPASIEIIVE